MLICYSYGIGRLFGGIVLFMSAMFFMHFMWPVDRSLLQNLVLSCMDVSVASRGSAVGVGEADGKM